MTESEGVAGMEASCMDKRLEVVVTLGWGCAGGIRTRARARAGLQQDNKTYASRLGELEESTMED